MYIGRVDTAVAGVL